MKTKYISFSNFKFNHSNINNDDKNLVIEDLYNINTNNGCIQSEINLNNIISELFNDDIANNIKSNNLEVLSTFVKIIPYEYFNENSLKTEVRLFGITNNYKLYELNKDTCIFEEKYLFEHIPKDILSENILYIFDINNKCVIVENENILSIENIPYIETFSSDFNYLYFTTNKNPSKILITEKCHLKNISTNLNQYSFLQTTIEDGPIYKIVNIKDNIYIITQYSILRLDNKNNILIKQNSLNLQIYKNSINQIDDYIIFYSTNGLYTFDGSDIKQIFPNCLNVDKSAIFICFNHNLYILSEFLKNIIYKYSLTDNQLSIINCESINNIYPIKTFSNYNICINQLITNNYKTNVLYSKLKPIQSNQYVKFKTTFLGTDKEKQIKNLHINCSGDFTLKISSNFTESHFNISNSTSLSNLLLNGTFFNFEIISNSYFKLNSILLCYDEIGD